MEPHISAITSETNAFQASPDPHTSHFMLSEGVYACAEVPPTDSVLLWLGVRVSESNEGSGYSSVCVLQANVMLEYPIAGAEQLLCRNLAQAESSLRQVDEDMDHIRDQCTTLEVGILPVTPLKHQLPTGPKCVCEP